MSTAAQWRQTFDAWAAQDPTVASTGAPSSAAELASVGDLLADWLQLDGTQRVLDVGCASGLLTATWAHRAGSVVGIDRSLPLLRQGALHQSDVLRPLCTDATALPFANGSFDRVCCFGVLLCLPDHAHADRAVDEILRVAAPGARIVLGSLPDPRHRETFFDHCDAQAPWLQRAVPRRLRWTAKRLLRPGVAVGKTAILWFDIDALAERLRDRGFHVAVEVDPEFTNYAAYRKTLVLSDGGGTR